MRISLSKNRCGKYFSFWDNGEDRCIINDSMIWDFSSYITLFDKLLIFPKSQKCPIKIVMINYEVSQNIFINNAYTIEQKINLRLALYFFTYKVHFITSISWSKSIISFSMQTIIKIEYNMKIITIDELIHREKVKMLYQNTK
jgi:hypothetical protein